MKVLNRIQPIGFSGGLLLGLSPLLVTAQVPVELTSITSTTNGVSVAWTNPAPGYAYTVQVRESLTSGAWRNGKSRYRWPSPLVRWGDAPVNLPAARYYRVIANTNAAPQRGKLLTSRLGNQYTSNQLNGNFTAWGIIGIVQPKSGVVNRPFTYETVDPYGLPITASALLILPQGTNGPLPLVSYQHGTIVRKSDAYSVAQPSTYDIEYVFGNAFASHGYAVVMPDYLGLGTSPGFQAWMHAKSEATSVVDALRAARALCASNRVTLNGQLFLTGYSQGGHATMAAQRELEAFHADEFTVTASAPCAGPYDFGGVQVDDVLAGHPLAGQGFFLFVLASWLPIYHLGDTLEELLAEPYRRTAPPLMDKAVSTGVTPTEIDAVLPEELFNILRADLQADFQTNVHNSIRQAFMDNEVYAWTPRAPVKMFHCRGDHNVIFANSEVAYQSFTNRGACCVSLVDPGAPAELDHNDCYVPSLREIMAWFESLRQ
jgi:hypothetical protein